MAYLPTPIPASLATGVALSTVTLLLTAPLTARAAKSVEPSVAIGAEYRSNPRSDRISSAETPATAVTFDARLPIRIYNEKAEFVLQPRVDIKRNTQTKNKNLDAEDLWLTASADYAWQRAGVGISGGAADLNIRSGTVQQQLDGDTGEGTRDRIYVSPYITLALSARNVLRISGGYDQSDYDFDNPSDSRNLTTEDYDSTYGTVALERSIGQADVLSLGVTYSIFNSENKQLAQETRNERTQVNLIHQHSFSETLSSTINLGYSDTDNEFTFFNVPFNPRICITQPAFCPPPTTTEDSDSNFVGDASLQKSSERTTYRISIAQLIQPSSQGGEVTRTSVSGDISHQLTRRLGASVNALAFTQESVFPQSGGNVKVDRDYAQFSTGLRWRFTERVTTSINYRFTWDDQPFGDYRDHTAWMEIRYNAKPWR